MPRSNRLTRASRGRQRAEVRHTEALSHESHNARRPGVKRRHSSFLTNVPSSVGQPANRTASSGTTTLASALLPGSARCPGSTHTPPTRAPCRVRPVAREYRPPPQPAPPPAPGTRSQEKGAGPFIASPAPFSSTLEAIKGSDKGSWHLFKGPLFKGSANGLGWRAGLAFVPAQADVRGGGQGSDKLPD